MGVAGGTPNDGKEGRDASGKKEIKREDAVGRSRRIFARHQSP